MVRRTPGVSGRRGPGGGAGEGAGGDGGLAAHQDESSLLVHTAVRLFCCVVDVVERLFALSSLSLSLTNKNNNHHTTKKKEHCLVGLRGKVTRGADGQFVHANCDIDVLVTPEPSLGVCFCVCRSLCLCVVVARRAARANNLFFCQACGPVIENTRTLLKRHITHHSALFQPKPKAPKPTKKRLDGQARRAVRRHRAPLPRPPPPRAVWRRPQRAPRLGDRRPRPQREQLPAAGKRMRVVVVAILFWFFGWGRTVVFV